MRKRGVRYALYTDTQRDGLLQGVNEETTAALAKATGLRIIAAGGVATVEDVRRLRQRSAAGIEGVVIGQALYRGTVALPEAIRLARDEPSPSSASRPADAKEQQAWAKP
jgi:phosphoribosylformimino-5-aminoimidazole carboxamide ribotide isomerase